MTAVRVAASDPIPRSVSILRSIVDNISNNIARLGRSASEQQRALSDLCRERSQYRLLFKSNRPHVMFIANTAGEYKYVIKHVKKEEMEMSLAILKNTDGLCKNYIIEVVYYGTFKDGNIDRYYIIVPYYTDDETLYDKSERVLFFKMMFATLCLHKQGLVHSDIKDENFFGHRLGDFGITNRVTGNGIVGVEPVPPEFFQSNHFGFVVKGKTYRIDLWGLGLILLQLYKTGYVYGFLFERLGTDQKTIFPRRIEPSVIQKWAQSEFKDAQGTQLNMLFDVSKMKADKADSLIRDLFITYTERGHHLVLKTILTKHITNPGSYFSFLCSVAIKHPEIELALNDINIDCDSLAQPPLPQQAQQARAQQARPPQAQQARTQQARPQQNQRTATTRQEEVRAREAQELRRRTNEIQKLQKEKRRNAEKIFFYNIELEFITDLVANFTTRYEKEYKKKYKEPFIFAISGPRVWRRDAINDAKSNLSEANRALKDLGAEEEPDREEQLIEDYNDNDFKVLADETISYLKDKNKNFFNTTRAELKYNPKTRALYLKEPNTPPRPDPKTKPF